jgi:hypothetical protein
LHVTTAGATVSDLNVVGILYVDAPDVTVERVRVTTSDDYFGIKQGTTATNLTVRDSEVVGVPGVTPTEVGISQSTAGLTVTRVLIRGVVSGIHLGAGSVTVSGSRIDQLSSSSQVGIGSTGDTPDLSFTDNTILISSDAGGAIVLNTTDGGYANVTIRGNVLAGGASTLVGGADAGSHDIRVTGNQFSRMYYPDCGSTGPVASYDSTEPGNVWNGNTWADTGQPVVP